MSNNTEKTFLKGSFKEVGQYGSIAISLNAEQLEQIAGGEDYIKLKIVKRKEVDKFGNTHYCILDTFKPDQRQVAAREKEVESAGSIDDLPF